MKIISIVGARPQFIKLAPLSKELKNLYNAKIIHTGQHFDYEMSKLFFQELGIPEPDYNLGINNGYHGEQTGKMLIELEKTILKEKPDLIIVYGDTNTTLAGSLVSSKLNIPVVHIEAGLRSFNKKMPEEINRIISDHISDYLFAPTKKAIENLELEGLISKAYLTGDIMVDVLYENLERAKKYSNLLGDLNLTSDKYLLLTLHRPYNVDNPEVLKIILDKLSQINMKILFPIHPRTRRIIEDNRIKMKNNIITTKPFGYLEFLSLEMNSNKIITDSGGIQKEAYILKKPCITIRSETEWIETVEAGWNLLLDYLDPDFVDKIIFFQPADEQKDIFGSNVKYNMLNIIKKILH